MKLFAACLLLLGASACANGPAADEWCLTNAPIRPTLAETERLSDALVEDILRHDTYGARRCGWKP